MCIDQSRMESLSRWVQGWDVIPSAINRVSNTRSTIRTVSGACPFRTVAKSMGNECSLDLSGSHSGWISVWGETVYDHEHLIWTSGLIVHMRRIFYPKYVVKICLFTERKLTWIKKLTWEKKISKKCCTNLVWSYYLLSHTVGFEKNWLEKNFLMVAACDWLDIGKKIDLEKI